MKVWIYTIVFNEEKILPYYLRNYSPWVERMIVYVDQATNDGTVEILKANPKVELRTWPHKTGLDDQEFINTANHWPSHEGRKENCDWVGFVDADELLYHPDPWAMLHNADVDSIRAKGYALLSPIGWPQDDGRQIYEQVVTGVHQENENKYLLWRPGFDVGHHHGRHDRPTFNGRIDDRFRMKNYHCHFLGGVQPTKARNARNFDRAHDKNFAWNFNDESERQGIGGTVKWVAKALGQVFDVTKDAL